LISKEQELIGFILTKKINCYDDNNLAQIMASLNSIIGTLIYQQFILIPSTITFTKKDLGYARYGKFNYNRTVKS